MHWFYARDILACLDLDPNHTLVAVADLCTALGLPVAREERRVKAHSVLRQGARRLAAEPHDGGAPARLCLRIELVPLWLTTLNPEELPDPALRDRLALFQCEAASLLWQAFRPQGFDSGDGLIAPRSQQGDAEQAYVGAMAIANLARQQVLIERQLDTAPADDEGPGADPWAARDAAVDDSQAARVARTVRRVARTLGERTRRNEYWGALSGLYRNFGISSYRRMPAGRLYEALEWLERWYGDMMGEPEPPPDI